MEAGGTLIHSFLPASPNSRRHNEAAGNRRCEEYDSDKTHRSTEHVHVCVCVCVCVYPCH